MIVAIPIKKVNDRLVVSNAFGKAKKFAILKNKDVLIVETDSNNGKEVIDFLSKHNVNTVIVSHMGFGAFKYLKQKGLKAYIVEKFLPIEDALKMLEENKLEEFKHDLSHKHCKCVS
ncbi:MAG TPA: hypothetical protein EYH43_00760 [Persephonella sp.]|nr:hypothetical protein [Hydrogenothermaceae bacterium]HIQ24500.1 hypothetical protein [Persephonella sp.]